MRAPGAAALVKEPRREDERDALEKEPRRAADRPLPLPLKEPRREALKEPRRERPAPAGAASGGATGYGS